MLIIYCKIGLFLSLICESSMLLIDLFPYIWFNWLWQPSHNYFLLCHFMSWYIKHTSLNIFQSSLGLICFALLCLSPDAFIIHFLDGVFFPSVFGSSSFICLMTLWAYTITDLGEISPIWLCFPARQFVYFGSTCEISISHVATMYDYSYLRG